MAVADGPTSDHATNSGVAHGIVSAIERRPDSEVVLTIDGSVRGIRRAFLAVLTFRPKRSNWWARLNLGYTNLYIRSRMRDRAASKAGEFDFILQIRNIYLPSRFPVIVFIDSTSAMANDGWASWNPGSRLAEMRRRVEQEQFERAHHIVTAGEWAAESVVKQYGIDPQKVTAIGGGVNFSPLPEPSAYELRSWTDPRILFVGLDFERKGGDLLLSAFRRVREAIPAARLTIVGASQTKQTDGVTYLGRVSSRTDMQRIYAESTLFCLPARHEPYGLVLQEAMAFGLPCIATRVGAVETIVENGTTGLIVEPENAVDLAEAIIRLASNAHLSEGMGRAGRARVETAMTWDSVAERLITALKAEH